MLGTKVRSGTGGLYLRAITLGTVTGVTSEARPIRSQREPGCMTITFEPLRPYIDTYGYQFTRVQEDYAHLGPRGCGSLVNHCFVFPSACSVPGPQRLGFRLEIG